MLANSVSYIFIVGQQSFLELKKYKFLSAIAYTFLYIYLEEKIGADA